MQSKQTIILDHLSIGYLTGSRKTMVGKDLTSVICQGELTCLLGANGIGKSTLLRTLSAFQPKLGGSVCIKGREIGNYSEKELARLVSVVLTERLDMKNMQVREVIGLGRSPYTGFWGKLNDEDEREVDRAIALVKIEALRERMVDTLSDGERQKMMIAKALAQDTPIILLDEPTAFLDYPSKVEMMQLLHRLSRQTDKTIFLSTHDLELALQIADKIWLLDSEAGLQVGTPEDLSLDGSLSRFFAGEGISFDPATGLFKIENEYQSQIRLTGHGPRYLMARKALLRNGIYASTEVDSSLSIEAKPASYLIRQVGQSPLEVPTIVRLLEEVLARQ